MQVMRCLVFVHLVSLIVCGGVFAEEQLKKENDFSTFYLPLGIPNKNEKSVLQSLVNARDYFLTPGDIFEIQIILNRQKEAASEYSYKLMLQKDYSMEIPFLGNRVFKGCTYVDARRMIIEEVRRKIVPDYVDFNMITPSQFEIYVGGAVLKPGLIIGNSLMSAGEAILSAGGFSEYASYRTVEVYKENGEKRVVDFSEFARSGNPDQNPYLKAGERIVVPFAERIVTLTGLVKVPGRYELLPGEHLRKLIENAWGFLDEADRNNLLIRRVKADGEYTYFLAAFPEDSGWDVELFPGDTIQVSSKSLNQPQITVEGALYGKVQEPEKPKEFPSENEEDDKDSTKSSMNNSISAKTIKAYLPLSIKVSLPYFPGISLDHVLRTMGGPTPFALPDSSKIYKKNSGQEVKFDVFRMWNNPKEAQNIVLDPDDYVLIPMKQQVVFVTGEVMIPGALAYKYRRTLGDYLIDAGGIRTSGDKNAMFLMTPDGRKIRKIEVNYEPMPEDIIFVDKNAAQIFSDVVGIVAPFVTTLSTISVAVWTILTTLGVIK